ncbi:MAG: hypothetical protein WCG47_31100 [Dermatophilaceae bacterium]
MTWTSMAYGAGLSAVLAVVLVAVAARDRRPAVLATAAGAALLMPIAWNTILRLTGATDAFSHDLPLRIFPISWQDTGTGVFTLAGASLLLALLSARRDPAPRTAVLALWTALAALLIDIYLY